MISKKSKIKKENTELVKGQSMAAIVPTHKPSSETYRLITDLVMFNKSLQVLVVDDCTPESDPSFKIISKLHHLAEICPQVEYIRTPENKLKAGAINYGLGFIQLSLNKYQTVFVLDDDVIINQNTISSMAACLDSEKEIGAVCSQAYVINKNQNLITRLQGLEYHSFNTSKISDNTFLKGPLVAQGMLSAFRMDALKSVEGYSTNHLIEDYDITVRLKRRGWKIKLAPQAEAWTVAPDSISDLWKQRVRWTLGGLKVVKDNLSSPLSIFQDLLGHSVFLATVILVPLSFMSARSAESLPILVYALLTVVVLNFVFCFAYGILLLSAYPSRDKWDYLIRVTLLPEFIYGNFLTLVLIGSYLFYLYSKSHRKTLNNYKAYRNTYQVGLAAFQKIGYSSSWGTR